MPKILVVDDAPQTRGLIASILVLERFEVVMAADGFEGIERARAELPDLIITHLNMPGLPGIEMIKRIRVDPELKSVPILAITSHDMETAMNALKAGANRALASPVEEHLLLAFVFDLLAKKDYSNCQSKS